MIYIGMAAAMASCAPKQEETAEQPQPKEAFKYLVDEFADLRIMRYQIPEWDQLTLQQKSYIYYLGEAAKCGRDILADQNFKYNLTVRKTVEAVLNSYKGDRESADFQDFVEDVFGGSHVFFAVAADLNAGLGRSCNLLGRC